MPRWSCCPPAPAGTEHQQDGGYTAGVGGPVPQVERPVGNGPLHELDQQAEGQRDGAGYRSAAPAGAVGWQRQPDEQREESELEDVSGC